jgi:hypothetical protein
MTTRTEHLLACLFEECAELSKEAAKAVRFGLDDTKPGDELTNGEKILEELNDVYAIIDMLWNEKTLKRTCAGYPKNHVLVVEKVRAKQEKVEKYMEYARSNGSLEKNPTRSEELREEAQSEDNDIKAMGIHAKALREERAERFEDYRNLFVKEGYDLTDHKGQGKITISPTEFGVLDYYSKANKVLVRSENKWHTAGLRWLIKNLLKDKKTD